MMPYGLLFCPQPTIPRSIITNMADDGEEEGDDFEDGYFEDGFEGEEDIGLIELSSDSNSTNSDSGGEMSADQMKKAASSKINFDQSLPSRHEYLGEMEEFSGRTVLDADGHVTLPLLPLPGMVLVPAQTLPLQLFQPVLVAMMKNVLEKDRTFGLINVRYTDDQGQQLAAIGTTAEIFSMKEESEAGITTLRIKATGRQRFRVIEMRRGIDGTLIGTVHILQEAPLRLHPEGALQCCQNKSGCQAATRGNSLQMFTGKRRLGMPKYRKVCTSLSWWPSWVYELHNPYKLMEHIKTELKSWSEMLRLDNLPTEPVEFSYWVAANIPVDNNTRVQILAMNSPIQRLRRELDIMRKYSVLSCRDCNCRIANKSDLFSMSLDGPLGAYVNPGGYVHETLTFHKATGVRLRGRSSDQNSWFPGYAWTIAECTQCSNHLGWKFTAVKKGLNPAKFWGLTRAALTPSLRSEGDSGSVPSVV